MADEFQEKTEQPTPRRLEEARRKGQVAKSMEVNSSAILLVGLLIIYLLAGFLYSHLQYSFQLIFRNLYVWDINPMNIQHFFLRGTFFIGKMLAPVFMGLLLVGLAISYGQVGFMISPEALKPKFEKLNAIEGIRKILFSRRTLEELVKNILKVTIIIWVAYSVIRNKWDEFFMLLDQDVQQIFIFTVKAAFSAVMKIAIAFIFIAGADYAFQRWDHLKKLMMSRQEIKDEYKQMEGDPQIKSAIRKKQMQLATRRMIQEVPKADVVVANPTHYAVALKYDAKKMAAPVVIAKGVDEVARKIREVAEKNQVPVVEDPPLARALYDAVDVNKPIPEKFFQAVAELLAYVYKLKGKTI